MSEEKEVKDVAQEAVSLVKEEESKPENDQVKNFKALREAKEKVERDRDEMHARLKQIEENIDSVVAPKAEEYSEPAPDDLVEWRHVQRKINKLESEMKNYQQTATVSATETKLKQQHPDFDAVVSKENVDKLRVAYPEIAQTLNASGDLYSKAVSAYTLIKKLGIYQDENFDKEKGLAQENSLKPKPLASVSPNEGSSPLSNANAFANGLTDELKQKLYREMIDARKAI